MRAGMKDIGLGGSIGRRLRQVRPFPVLDLRSDIFGPTWRIDREVAIFLGAGGAASPRR